MKKINSNSVWKAAGGFIGLIALFACLVAVNIILDSFNLRKDFTADKLYSLSDGSKSMLNDIDEKVTLKLFFNGSNPRVPVSLKTYAQQVEDLLYEYRMTNPRRISIEKYDPKPDSDTEEWAQKYGIVGQPIEMFGPPLYFGLVAVAGAREQVIPFLDPRAEELLEYNISRLIYKATHPQRSTIGILSSLSVLGSTSPFAPAQQPQQTWLAFQNLQQDYDIIPVSTDTDNIDIGIDTLVIVHPKDLPDITMYAIDQFLMRGGKIIAFLDPVSTADLEANPPQQYRVPKAASNLKPLLAAWGIEYDQTQVLADMNAASRIRSGDGQIEDSPVWLSLRKENIAKDDLLTARLDSIMLPFSGTFVDNTSDDLTVTPLLTSSSNAGLIHFMNAQFGAGAINRDFKPAGIPLNIAMRITGTFPTAFPDGRPESADAGSDKKEEKPDETKDTGLKTGSSAVILIGDSDMIYDRFCVQEMNFFGARAFQPLNDNINFFQNAVEQMSGSTDLIAIRSRGKFDRPFERVRALEQKAQNEWREKEQDLTMKLTDTQQKLNQLQAQKESDQRYILSNEQKKALESFKNEEIRIKQELRNVKKNLRKDIDQLGMQLKFINIALMPLLVCVMGVAFAMYRRFK